MDRGSVGALRRASALATVHLTVMDAIIFGSMEQTYFATLLHLCG
jgi:hypothetical protein